jgi:hypothetical protein
MIMKKLTLLSVLGLAMFAPMAPKPAEAQISKVGGGYLLRIKHVKGAVQKYRVTTTMAAMGKPMIIDVTSKVVGVKGKVGTVESTVTMTMNGQKGKPQISKMEVNDRGQIVGGDKNQMMLPMALPEKPVAVGSKWSGEMNAQGMVTKSQYVFNGVKKVNGRDVADISFTLTGGMPGSKVAGKGKSMVLVSDGSLQSLNMDMNLSIPTPKGQKPQKPMAMSMVMQRL